MSLGKSSTDGSGSNRTGSVGLNREVAHAIT